MKSVFHVFLVFSQLQCTFEKWRQSFFLLFFAISSILTTAVWYTNAQKCFITNFDRFFDKIYLNSIPSLQTYTNETGEFISGLDSAIGGVCSYLCTEAKDLLWAGLSESLKLASSRKLETCDMKMRMAKFWFAIIVSCVTLVEFHFIRYIHLNFLYLSFPE